MAQEVHGCAEKIGELAHAAGFNQNDELLFKVKLYAIETCSPEGHLIIRFPTHRMRNTFLAVMDQDIKDRETRIEQELAEIES